MFPLCVLSCVLSSSPSDEDTSPFLPRRAARVRTVRHEGESGGEGHCHPGVPGWPSCRLLVPGTRESWEEGAWGATHFLSPCPHRSLLGSIHFLLLVFLKVPLLLSLLGAVLWVNRPLRSSGGKPQENQQPPWPSTLSREKDPQTEEKGIFFRQ